MRGCGWAACSFSSPPSARRLRAPTASSRGRTPSGRCRTRRRRSSSSARASSRGRPTARRWGACRPRRSLRAFRAQSEMPYARYVTGRFTGTTDEVIQWAARKWGFAPDLLRAVATQETYWKMSFIGDDGDSFGLFQVRRPFHCKEPVCEQFRSDAAFNADYYAGIVRAYYDGKQRWLDDVAAENGKPY